MRTWEKAGLISWGPSRVLRKNNGERKNKYQLIKTVQMSHVDVHGSACMNNNSTGYLVLFPSACG